MSTRQGWISFLVIFGVVLTSCGKKETEEELFAQAKQYENKSDFKAAVQAYEKLAKRFPEGKHGVESLLRAAKLNTQTKQFKRAISDYWKIIKIYPKSTWAPKARFMIGFIYANNLKDSTRAKEIYQRLTEDEVFANAEDLEKQEDYRKAIQAYQNIVTFFPSGKRRCEALSKAAYLYVYLKEFEKAISTHQKIINTCPDSNLVRQSRFMVGFIYANDLKDYQKAKEAYNLFLKKYPNDELVPSVKWELANLGKDINEIKFLSTTANKRKAKGGQ